MNNFMVILAAGVLFSGCASHNAWHFHFRPPSDAHIAREIAHADSLWQERGVPKSARQAVRAFEHLAKIRKHDAELWTRLARAYYLQANYTETNPDKQYWLFLKGMQAAEKALMLQPRYRNVMSSTGSELQAVKQLDAANMEAAWWYAANLAKRVADESAIIRLGNAALVEAFCSHILSLDEKYYYGGPHRFMGGIYARLPEGDLVKARFHFERSLELAPDYFGTRTLYAEYYAVRAGDRKLFQEQLEYVLATPPGSIPEVEPENRYEQQRAKVLLARMEKLFPASAVGN